MAADIRELKDQAAKHFAKGKFDKAASAYSELCKLEPKDAQLRVRLGDALVKAGNKEAAVGAYKFAAESYARDGFLPRAIAVCKLILEVDPKHVATQETLAQLYAKRTGPPAKPAAAAPAAAAPAPAKASPAPAAAAPPAPTAAVGDTIELELDTGGRTWEAGVKSGSEGADEQPASGLELEAPDASAGWKGASSWEPPQQVAAPAAGEVEVPIELETPKAKAAAPGKPPAPAPQPKAPAAPLELEAPAEPAPAAKPAPVAAPPSASHGADVLFSDAKPASRSFSLAEVDLGEPDIAPEPASKPKPAPAAPTTAVELDPGEAVADSLEAALAQSTGSKVAAAAPAPGSWFAPPEVAAGSAPASLADLEIGAVEDEKEVAPAPQAPEAPRSLPEIPLFSDLSREAFVELASRCDLRRAEAGQTIVEEGTVGSSFFVVCSGQVKVCKKAAGGEVLLAKLGEGAFFGEMALLSGAPRTASVLALDEVECLEISAALLGELQKRYPQVGQVLKKFAGQRLLNNVMSTSQFFRPFDKSERNMLVERFKSRQVVQGEKVVQEGQPTDGLYVVMLGELEVRRSDGTRLAQLKQGELFGEISLLTKSAATADVVALKRSTLLRLPRESFNELISTHPQILSLVSELSDERLRQQQALDAGKKSPDGLLMV